jgi:hypothetical protein
MARSPLWFLLLAVSCVDASGLGDVGDGGPKGGNATRAPAPPKTGAAPLPQSGGKSLAVWTCSGGGSATATAQIGVTMGALSGSSAVAPSGATIVVGHFVDSLE